MKEKYCKTYLEIPLAMFIMRYPEFVSCFKQYDLTDSNYIVRIASDGTIEVGYPDDEWLIK